MDYSVVKPYLQDSIFINMDEDFSNCMLSLLALGATYFHGVYNRPNLFSFPDLDTMDWEASDDTTIHPWRLCTIFFVVCPRKIALSDQCHRPNITSIFATVLVYKPHPSVFTHVDAYKILQQRAPYINNIFNSCGRMGIGHVVRLDAMHDQIQLLYSEITAMISPDAFVLDLLTNVTAFQVKLRVFNQN
jgi:hypothetical protein